MSNRIYFILLFAFPVLAKAQITERVTINAGEDIAAVLSTHGLYVLPNFKTAKVNFKDGHSVQAQMNFNIYENEMHFINENGDTLVLNDPQLVDSILFDSTSFYFQDGYRQVIDGNNNSKLVLKRDISFQYVKRGALGLPAGGGVSAESYGSIVPRYNMAKKLVVNEDIIAIKKSFYYIIDKDGKETSASHSGFLSAFPALKNELKEYTDKNNISYKKENDLKKVFKFCMEHS